MAKKLPSHRTLGGGSSVSVRTVHGIPQHQQSISVSVYPTGLHFSVPAPFPGRLPDNMTTKSTGLPVSSPTTSPPPTPVRKADFPGLVDGLRPLLTGLAWLGHVLHGVRHDKLGTQLCMISPGYHLGAMAMSRWILSSSLGLWTTVGCGP